MLRRIIHYLFEGIAWGCTFFVVTGLTGVLTAGDAFLQPIMDSYVEQALGSMFVGICCGSTSIVYTFKKLAWWQAIGIHFLVGLSGYFAVAFKLGWIPNTGGLPVLFFVVFGILVFTVIWAVFYVINKRETKRVNERLKEIEKGE